MWIRSLPNVLGHTLLEHPCTTQPFLIPIQTALLKPPMKYSYACEHADVQDVTAGFYTRGPGQRSTSLPGQVYVSGEPLEEWIFAVKRGARRAAIFIC